MIHQFFQSPFPVIDIDKKFYLREQVLGDAEAFFEYYTDPLVAQHILATNPKTLLEASNEVQYCHNLFHKKQGIYWTIARKSDDKMIGAIGLYINLNHLRGELCYDLSRNYWRKGIMKAALSKVIDFSFSKIGLNRLEALTIESNVASIGVLEKLGFHREGILKNYRFFQHKSHDVLMLALTPSAIQSTAKDLQV
jgi:ribosomal-protein-alanine N-acetyltransferase